MRSGRRSPAHPAPTERHAPTIYMVFLRWVYPQVASHMDTAFTQQPVRRRLHSHVAPDLLPQRTAPCGRGQSHHNCASKWSTRLWYTRQRISQQSAARKPPPRRLAQPVALCIMHHMSNAQRRAHRSRQPRPPDRHDPHLHAAGSTIPALQHEPQTTFIAVMIPISTPLQTTHEIAPLPLRW